MKIEVDDDYIMPFGQFKGQRVGDVPAYYLLYLHDKKIAMGKLRIYIESNKELLEKEVNMPSKARKSTLRDDEYESMA